MASRLSRRALAAYAASQLITGDDKVLAQLAAYLIETRRQSEAELIVRDIERALADEGLVVADISSAHELSQTLLKGVTANIVALSGATEVQTRTTVDSTLIGGVRVRTPGAEYDGTVRRKLTKLQAMKV